jgi:predicted enzyme related to lactoylglutathione lyase
MGLTLAASFCRFELRTTDVPAARAFYATLFGHDHAAIWPLPEQARARGAVPHWLGHIDLGDAARLADATRAFIARGAVQLGPTFTTDDRGQFAILRDPGGAIVALAAPPHAGVAPVLEVPYCALNTNNVAAARANYSALFGWDIVDSATAGTHGAYHEFSYRADAPARVGAFADIANRPGIHAHWLFFFRTDAIENAVAHIRDAGGTAQHLPAGPDGARIAACEDPQGAAFGLIERAP